MTRNRQAGQIGLRSFRSFRLFVLLKLHAKWLQISGKWFSDPLYLSASIFLILVQALPDWDFRSQLSVFLHSVTSGFAFAWPGTRK